MEAVSTVSIGGEALLKANLSYNIRYTIRDKNTSAAAVARAIGMSPDTFRAYLRGEFLFDYNTVKKIADVLECDVAELTKRYDPSMPNGD